MKIRRFMCVLIPLAAISCQPPAESSEGSAPGDSQAEAKSRSTTVTIDGREATPLEKQAFTALTEKLLSDAISKAVSEGCEKLLKKLDITDPTEAALFAGSVEAESDSEKECDGELLYWSVYLIRPGKETKEARTITLLREGKPFLRFTRAIEAIERPLAVMSVTTTKKSGGLCQVELLLVYESDGKWKQHPSSERKEDLKDDK